MSPNRRAGPPGGADIDPPLNEVIEQGIDAVNALRVRMRKAGMAACADALDEAFAHCLKDYMSLKANDAASGASAEGEEDKTLN